MSTVALALAASLAVQSPLPEPALAVLKAGLGPCSADFTVTDRAGAPVYGALIHVRVRYGLWSIKRADLEVGTNSAGRARIDELPSKARPLQYDIRRDSLTGTAGQRVADTCQARFAVSLVEARP